MKLSKLFAVAVMAAGTLSLSAQGIEFMPEGSTLQSAVDKAKQEGKMVFLDCYTSWCGPCKMMANKIFPTQEVGDFMNPKFVSIKIDMEKGEGPDIAKNLQINAYPTFVIFNNDGSEAARFVGGGDAQSFMKRVNDNLGDNGPAALEARFKAGDRDPKFLLDYLDYLGNVYRSQQCNVVAELLLEGKTETFAADSSLRKVFVKYISNPFHPTFIYAAKNKETVAPLMGEKTYKDKMASVYDRYSRSMVKKADDGKLSIDRARFDEFNALLKELNAANAGHYRYNTIMMCAERNEDWASYIDAMEGYLADSSLDMSDLGLCLKSAGLIKMCKDQSIRERMKKLIATRLDDLKSGRRAAQVFPEGRQPKQSPTESLQMLLDELNKAI